MTLPRVVVTQNIPIGWLSPLEGVAEVTVVDNRASMDEARLIEQIENAEGALTMLSDPVSARVLNACPNLKVVANYAVGYNNIDLDAAKEKNIVVCNTPGVLTEATAELALALLMAASRRIVESDRYCRRGDFVGWHATLMLGMELTGKTMGIYGMGRIGQAFARRAKACGMQILYHNRNRIDATIEAEFGATYVSFDELLAQSDVISLHCPLNEESQGRFTADEFHAMKRGSILINTARGAVVDEADLVEALRDGQLRAAGLDVFEEEPEIHPELPTLENVVMAPHIGSATDETRQKMAEIAAADIAAVLQGRDAINRVG